MTQPIDEFENGLMSLIRDGDEAATQKIFQQYAFQLARLAELQLSRRVARRIDGEDIVQSVFRAFFVRMERGEFQINANDQLWKLLVQITLRKAAEQGRYHTAQMRDGRLEADDMQGLSQLMARPPEDAEARLINEEIDRAISKLPEHRHAVYRQLLEMRLAGHSKEEIAQHLAVTTRTIERMLERLQRSLINADAIP